MTGWCPYIDGETLENMECHFDGYCSECPYYIGKQKEVEDDKEKEKA